ncbi:MULTISPECIES: MFS transporter [unclassified Streptomyces]|uniref:MFS transporter n=1 Tax=unclassified Streptomyces TaxID=2593676 RepID=UPI0022593C99|nr:MULTISPECIES: MFS transporter [unclassified Streptomyces]MCX5143875.1 MFS transporter [Streptomyces sp. NBC_00338]
MTVRWLRDYVPPGPTGRRLALISFIDSVGTGLFLASSAVFAVRHIGLDTSQFGWAMSAAGLVGLIVGVPLGRLGDRIGPRRLLVTLQLWRAVWFSALAFAWNLSTFVVIVCCLALAEAAVSPLTQVVVASAVGDDQRVRTMAILRTLRNAGFSVGALAATPLLTVGTAWAFRSTVLANGVSFVIAALVLARLRLVAHAPAPAAGSGALMRLKGLRDLPYLQLTALNSVLVLHMTLLSVGIPLWVVARTEAPVGVVAVLLAVNTVLAVLLQVPLSRRAEHEAGAVRCLIGSGLALAVCALALAGTGSVTRWPAVALLVAATVALTLGEILQSAGAWELSYRHAPADRRTEYLSTFNLGFSVQEIVGPVLLAGGVIALGGWGWLALGGLFCVATVLVRPVAGHLAASRAGSGPEGADTTTDTAVATDSGTDAGGGPGDSPPAAEPSASTNHA